MYAHNQMFEIGSEDLIERERKKKTRRNNLIEPIVIK